MKLARDLRRKAELLGVAGVQRATETTESPSEKLCSGWHVVAARQHGLRTQLATAKEQRSEKDEFKSFHRTSLAAEEA
jgi:hypothetical protein